MVPSQEKGVKNCSLAYVIILQSHFFKKGQRLKLKFRKTGNTFVRASQKIQWRHLLIASVNYKIKATYLVLLIVVQLSNSCWLNKLKAATIRIERMM